MKCKSNEQITEFLTPYATELGLEIVEVAMKMSKTPSLTVYIDKEGGVNLNDCEAFHNLITSPLDVLDPCPTAYTLNVSSPGVDRPLKTERDFMKKMNRPVEVKLYAPYRGSKFYEGVLTGYDGKSVTVLVGKEELKFSLSQISKINEAIVFD